MFKEGEERRKSYTREELQAYLTDIEEKVIDSDEAYLHSVIAINELLNLPNADEIFDEELKGRVRDLWIKLKSTGVHLNDPPLLFGLPENFGQEEENEEIVPVQGDAGK